MRVSTSYRFDSLQSAVSQTESRFIETQMRVSSGKKLNQPSDNPSGAAFSVTARNIRASLEQYSKNITSSKGTLSYTDTVLSDLSNTLNRVNQLAIQGANNATTPEARAGIRTEVTELQKKIVLLGNSQGPDGQFLFAGRSTKTKPYDVVNNALVFKGDSEALTSETAPGSTTALNTPGTPDFVGIYDQLETFKGYLQSGNGNNISVNTLKDIQKSIDIVNNTRGVIGYRIQTINDLQTQQNRRSDELTNSISDVEDVDMAEAITDYQKAQTAYQAALQVTSHGLRLSLMDYIQG